MIPAEGILRCDYDRGSRQPTACRREHVERAPELTTLVEGVCAEVAEQSETSLSRRELVGTRHPGSTRHPDPIRSIPPMGRRLQGSIRTAFNINVCESHTKRVRRTWL